MGVSPYYDFILLSISAESLMETGVSLYCDFIPLSISAESLREMGISPYYDSYLYLSLQSPWWGWAFPRTVISAPAQCWGFCQSEACQCWPSIFSPLRRCRIYVPWNPWYPFLCLWWWCHPRLLSDPHRNLPRPWRGDEVRTRWGSSVPVSRSTIQPTIADWPELFMLATYRHLIDKNDLIINSIHVSEKF